MIKQAVTALAISLLSTVALAVTPSTPKLSTTFDLTKVQCYADFKDTLTQASSQGFGIIFMFASDTTKRGRTILGKPSTQQVVEVETVVTEVKGKLAITNTCAVYVGENIPLGLFQGGGSSVPNQNAAPAHPLPPSQENETPDPSEKP